VLDEYVNSEALVTRADDLGYRVSDGELLAESPKVPAFQSRWKFDQGACAGGPQPQGRSGLRKSKELFRRDAKLRQLDAAAQCPSSFATPTELKGISRITRSSASLAWLTLSATKVCGLCHAG